MTVLKRPQSGLRQRVLPQQLLGAFEQRGRGQICRQRVRQWGLLAVGEPRRRLTKLCGSGVHCMPGCGVGCARIATHSAALDALSRQTVETTK